MTLTSLRASLLLAEMEIDPAALTAQAVLWQQERVQQRAVYNLAAFFQKITRGNERCVVARERNCSQTYRWRGSTSDRRFRDNSSTCSKDA
jgi:hypothetical protein